MNQVAATKNIIGAKQKAILNSLLAEAFLNLQFLYLVKFIILLYFEASLTNLLYLFWLIVTFDELVRVYFEIEE